MSSLYRDEGVVLRTQKLGEADRIITLLTREHGRVRAVAKGVRRTSSRFGARLEPFMLRRRAALRRPVARHRDAGRDDRRVRRADRRRLPRGTPPARRCSRPAERLDRDRARAGRPAVPAARRRAADAGAGRARPGAGARRLPAAVARRWPAGRRASSTARGAARPARTVRSPSPAGGMVCPPCRPPGAAAPHPQTLDLLAALLTGDWDAADAQRAAAAPRGERHRRGVPAVAPGAPGRGRCGWWSADGARAAAPGPPSPAALPASR